VWTDDDSFVANVIMNLMLCVISFLLIVVAIVSEDYAVLQRAITLYNTANTNVQSASYQKLAVSQYEEALSYYWEFPEAHQNLGLLYEKLEEYKLALQHHLYSIQYSKSKDFQLEALTNYVRLEILLSPMSKDVLVRGIREAENILQDCAGSASSLAAIALWYRQLGDSNKALHYLYRALDLQPSHVLTYLNIGNHFFLQSNFVDATSYYEKALQYAEDQEGYSEAVFIYINLGQTYRQRGLYHRSLEYLEKALLLTSADAGRIRKVSYLTNILAVKSLGNIWKEYEESEIEILSALSDMLSENIVIADPEYKIDPYSISLIRYGSAVNDHFVSHLSCPIVSSFHHPISMRVVQLVEASTFASTIHKESTSLRHQNIRIGYLSYDWRTHPMGRLTASLVTPTYDQQHQYHMYVHCFMYGDNDRSHVRLFVEKYCPDFRDLLDQTPHDQDAANLIAGKDIDILVDLTGHTYNGRIGISCFRPAPIVINYLGYPGTTGCSAFDYTMIDRIIGAVDYMGNGFRYSESLILLPFSYQSNFMPISRTSTSSSLSQAREKEDAFRICVFNANKKFEPVSFNAWMNVMQTIPQSELILLDVPEDAIEELLRQSAYHGIAALRLKFLPRMDWFSHLSRAHSQCDLALDNFVYGAHTTASDLLWMSVPIFVLSGYGSDFGSRMPSRVASSSINNLWYPDAMLTSEEAHDKQSIVDTLIQYSIKGLENVVFRVLRIGNGIERLSSIISKYRCTSPLFNSVEHTQTTAVAYHATFEIYNLLQKTGNENEFFKNYLEFLRTKYLAKNVEVELVTERTHSVLPHLVMVITGAGKEEKKNNFCVEEAELQNLPVNFVSERNSNGLTVKQERSFQWHEALSLNTSALESASIPKLLQDLMVQPDLWKRSTVIHIFSSFLNCQELTSSSSVKDSEISNCETMEKVILEWMSVLLVNVSHPMTTLVSRFLFETVHRYFYEQVIAYNNLSSKQVPIGRRLKETIFANIHRPCEDDSLSAFYTFRWGTLSQLEIQGFVYQLEACFFGKLFPSLRNSDVYFGPKSLSFLSTYSSEQVPPLLSWPIRLRWHFQRFLTVVGTTLLPPSNHERNKEETKDTIYSMRLLFAAFYWTPSISKANDSRSDHVSEYSSEEQADWLTSLKLTFRQMTGNAQAEELTVLAIRPLLNIALWTQNSPWSRGPWTFFLGYISMHMSHSMLPWIRHRDAPFNSSSLPTIPTQVFHPSLNAHFAGLQTFSSHCFDHDNIKDQQENLATKTVAIYCHEFGNGWFPGWGPGSFPSVYPFPYPISHLIDDNDTVSHQRRQEAAGWEQGKAAGGSEEAVAYFAVTLAQRGYRVHIFVDTLSEQNEYGYTLFFANSGHSHSSSSNHATFESNSGGYVRWLLRRDFDRTFPFDIFIAWRTAWNLALCPSYTFASSSTASKEFSDQDESNLKIKNKRPSCFLWAHDILPIESLPPLEIGGILVDGILTQSDFHRDLLATRYQQELQSRPVTTQLSIPSGTALSGFIRLNICPNGLPDSAFPEPLSSTQLTRHSLTFVYASAPYRGLQDLLEVVWPAIRERYPSAELHVFYGFSAQSMSRLHGMFHHNSIQHLHVPSWFVGLKVSNESSGGNVSDRHEETDPVNHWVLYMLHLLHITPGVYYRGAVSHEAMSLAWQQTSFFLYPTHFPETGCISMLRAMAGGALPITSRYTFSVLRNLGGDRFDLGPRDAPLTAAISNSYSLRQRWLHNEYLPAIFHALARKDDEELLELRQEMQQYVHDHHRWIHSADVFESILSL
jgi:predicted O-linked N-acetylglucosamine transferase (SPINDLY family)